MDETSKYKIGKESRCVQLLSEHNMLISVEFETLGQYLALLEEVSLSVSPLGPRACMYLAAAVSDFYIPDEQVRTIPGHQLLANSPVYS